MQIESIHIHPLHIPFKIGFKHSSAERKATQAILVVIHTTKDSIGLGEGCPREYVTQESLQTALDFCHQIKDEIINNMHSLDDIKQWIFQHTLLIDENPAAWCAMELALLDALSKDLEQSIEKTLDLPELSGLFQYTAVLGESSIQNTQNQVQQYRAMSFTNFKLKITGDINTDQPKMALLSDVSTLRLDANNIWEDVDTVLDYLQNILVTPFAMEEPLQAKDYASLEKLAHQWNGKIILDESFLNQRHFECIENFQDKVMINLRVSKMGGLLRSLQIAEMATQKQIPLIVGAQVGETSLLTRAALTVVQAFKSSVLAQEGAFGTLLLESDIVEKPLMFGKKGSLEIDNFLEKEVFGFELKYQNLFNLNI